MKYIAIIPARYQSVRFPGKPLCLLSGKPIIQHVYNRVAAAVEHVWVATDDERIAKEVASFGGRYVMTKADHPSGTDRCAEAAAIIAKEMDFDVVINVQGDEPFVVEEQIQALVSCFEDENTEISTLVKSIEDEDTLFNPNRPKVVFNKKNQALLFSRSTIPYLRGLEEDKWLSSHKYYSHLGMYAYRADILPELTKLEPTALEEAESLEQLRWLDNGYCIKVAETNTESIGIDTPEDLEKAQLYIDSLK